eukprot:6904678-Pyramimonas_sp.AAC.1
MRKHTHPEARVRRLREKIKRTGKEREGRRRTKKRGQRADGCIKALWLHFPMIPPIIHIIGHRTTANKEPRH